MQRNKFQLLGGQAGDDWEAYIFWIFDQRRYIAVRGSEEILPTPADAEEILNQCADDLQPNEVMVKVSPKGDLLTFSTSREDTRTRLVLYPIVDIQADSFKVDMVKRSDLIEEKRMYWHADLVSYANSDDPNHLAVFKIAIHSDDVKRMWNDAHFMRALKDHPSIVPFEKFVVDDVEPRLLGWTSTFIPGGTLEDNHSSTYFHFSWLTQMMEIVDDINLRYGIMHRDIAARNFLIDPETKRLLLFDFNNSVQIGDYKRIPKYNGPPDVDGVIFTIYELLTFDKSFRDCKVYWEHEVGPIERMVEWPIKAKLEPGLDGATIRQHLNNWVHERRTARSISHFSEATEPVMLPEIPEVPYSEIQENLHSYRLIDWTRPPFQKVPTAYYVPTLVLKEEEGSGTSPTVMAVQETMQKLSL